MPVICEKDLCKHFFSLLSCYEKIPLNKGKSVTGSLASFRKHLEWVTVFPCVFSSKNTVLQLYGIVQLSGTNSDNCGKILL